MRPGGFGAVPKASFHFAIRNIVSAGLGASILTIESVRADAGVPVILRALHPQLIRKLAIVRRSDKHDDPALKLVQDALLGLRNRALMPPGIRVELRRRQPGDVEAPLNSRDRELLSKRKATAAHVRASHKRARMRD